MVLLGYFISEITQSVIVVHNPAFSLVSVVAVLSIMPMLYISSDSQVHSSCLDRMLSFTASLLSPAITIAIASDTHSCRSLAELLDPQHPLAVALASWLSCCNLLESMKHRTPIFSIFISGLTNFQVNHHSLAPCCSPLHLHRLCRLAAALCHQLTYCWPSPFRPRDSLFFFFFFFLRVAAPSSCVSGRS